VLENLELWDDYLRAHSQLPGPRANLELVEAAILTGDHTRFQHLLALDEAVPGGAQPNTPDEFLTVCGVAGLGKLLAEGQHAWLPELHRRAADPRWRVREAVAIALQHWGDDDRPALITEMRSWCRGSWFVRRAVVAALAEPRVLRPTPAYDPTHDILPIFDEITAAVAAAACRKEEGFQVLRQALGYAWSVVVAANPKVTRPAFERWLHHAETSRDQDLAWIARQNLAKNRLTKLDPAWTTGWTARLATIRT
jgi:hypothetical protein